LDNFLDNFDKKIAIFSFNYYNKKETSGIEHQSAGCFHARKSGEE